jgi:predicted phage-related endonuclease
LNHSADAKKLRRYFIGGSDARIIMGTDEAALIWLWHEKRGEVEPEDLSGNLIVQLGVATEDRNDARGIAQMMRVGLYRPVHVKTLRSPNCARC